ncbi:Indole-3-pyruvate decarboxylase [Aquisphaera giovannonii]|uniref:Indole-3-pyruvate decarboxylase n=1 Tax=Aquisphaera giovannonii TaxID=406548 RepID=A0A5B9W2R4_9BACT|nr:thiamine pyrophosphate-binding protein [Aquisphaera giovannonii]QEH34878.1 Indole-3-pyruvate decarboxylase [Aquisphaera giovannonii]
MNLTEYLFARLRELGVGHTFGIPGDFILSIYAVQEAVGFPTVVCSHEPGVGFAADAYARVRGLGVALVTYGPGALNTLNPVACAYAEQSPLLVVSGGPEMSLRGQHDVHLHHVVRNYESQLRIYREVTTDAAVLEDPATAPGLIDRVLRNVCLRKRPGYLEIPRDRVRAEVAPPAGPLDLEPSAAAREASAGALDEVVEEIAAMLAGAKRPALYVGVGVRRHDLTAAVIRLAERLGLPVATDVLGKASFPESHPQFAGVYLGALGDPGVRELLDGSDCVLGIGVVRTDLGTGYWTERIDRRARILIDPDGVRLRHHRYDDLPIRRVVEALLERLPAGGRPAPAPPRPAAGGPGAPAPGASEAPAPGGRLRVADVIRELGRLDPGRYSFVADVGDSWFIGLELRTEVFLAAGYYASMGFAVPGALGAGVADPSRRPLAIVGDGAFQMTGTELATLVDQGLQPIVLLLNNSGYGMLEALDGPSPSYLRRDWDYPAMAAAMGARTARATTPQELAAALARAEAEPAAWLIEAITARDDLSPTMARFRDHVRSGAAPPPAM